MAASAMTWEWRQPVGGALIKWRPITVGDEMDLSASYRHDNNRHLLKWMQLAARIVAVDGVAKRVEVQDIRQWDAFDADTFYEEVQIQEARRAVALGKSDGSSPAAKLRAVSTRLEVATAELVSALRDAIAAAEEASARPTETPQPR